jgi:hypothetical protein
VNVSSKSRNEQEYIAEFQKIEAELRRSQKRI